MKKLAPIGIIVGILVAIGAAFSNGPVEIDSDTSHQTIQQKIAPEIVECNGTTVKSDCTVDNIQYKTYIYHPAVAEVSRTETNVEYKTVIDGYCTRCNDGTYSPSCATGRGACSWHGGVAEWNAPRYRQEPVTSSKKVIITPAKDAYYEKVKSN